MDFIALAHECAPSVAHETIVAIVKHESRLNPFAVGINGGTRISRQPNNQEEAIAIAEKLIAMGISIDMGLAQINSNNLKKLGLSVAEVFEPCNNLRAAEKVLHWCYDPAAKKHGSGQVALQAALSCYNTGNYSRGLSNGYVVSIYQIAAQ
ncbi:lytic transglycosylase domain-containing protein [Sulfurirhabdus autotrophica]|uniref:Type IV secretion system protein VirB1 n=1 Tax=Sulfurirhabdus autotrophica TaxID=1706046 RepID=A0A4R3XUV2_9PROT|nr:lytic transglycosylase domain-containing protein [Sulfurirhabdus autotrophica]TCV82742.1 type IV secretion system protein VirB1 [Sulfurirhabdus autotrophica]